jgi:hypothetical protein
MRAVSKTLSTTQCRGQTLDHDMTILFLPLDVTLLRAYARAFAAWEGYAHLCGSFAPRAAASAS